MSVPDKRLFQECKACNKFYIYVFISQLDLKAEIFEDLLSWLCFCFVLFFCEKERCKFNKLPEKELFIYWVRSYRQSGKKNMDVNELERLSNITRN
jgi:hypothetical protein